MPTTAFDRNAFIKSVWQALLAHRLTRAAYLIARAMLRRACRGGSLWPSQATLARDTGCCERTVLRALEQLGDLGLVTWRRRPGQGKRYATNLYRLLAPSLPLAGLAPKRRRPATPTKKELILESFSDKESDGSTDWRTPEEKAAGLQRLAALLGVRPDQVLPATA